MGTHVVCRSSRVLCCLGSFFSKHISLTKTKCHSEVVEVEVLAEAGVEAEEMVEEAEVSVDEVVDVVPDKDLFIQKKFVTFFMTFQYKLKKKSYWQKKKKKKKIFGKKKKKKKKKKS